MAKPFRNGAARGTAARTHHSAHVALLASDHALLASPFPATVGRSSLHPSGRPAALLAPISRHHRVGAVR